MIPIEPTLTVRELALDDAPALMTLLNPVLVRTAYSTSFDLESIATQLFDPGPQTIYAVRWQQQRRFGSWRAGELVGFLDCAIGFDNEHLHLPDYQPLGLLRFMALPERRDLIDQVMGKLLEAAENFWRMAGVTQIQAFHLSTGYPVFQAGAGILPGDWRDHFRLLTANGYTMTQRYQAMTRDLTTLVEETTPIRDLSLTIHGDLNDRSYELYHRRVDKVGSARLIAAVVNEMVSPTVSSATDAIEKTVAERRVRVAHLTDLTIEPDWRGRDLGKLLLRRIINDATLQSFKEILVYLPQGSDVGWSLFAQQGFTDSNYRGYTLEKELLEKGPR